MRNRTENFGVQLISFDLCQKTLFKKTTFYLPKITFILQDAPCKMLTFAQIPVVPGAQDSKTNYWKLDYSQITGKMVRRYFKGIMHLFPELASRVRTEKLNRQPEHQPAACRGGSCLVPPVD